MELRNHPRNEGPRLGTIHMTSQALGCADRLLIWKGAIRDTVPKDCQEGVRIGMGREKNSSDQSPWSFRHERVLWQCIHNKLEKTVPLYEGKGDRLAILVHIRCAIMVNRLETVTSYIISHTDFWETAISYVMKSSVIVHQFQFMITTIFFYPHVLFGCDCKARSHRALFFINCLNAHWTIRRS
jgi:hypothetical protein